jgi:hypothetical protein
MSFFIRETLIERFVVAARMIRAAVVLAVCGEVLIVFDGPRLKHSPSNEKIMANRKG